MRLKRCKISDKNKGIELFISEHADTINEEYQLFVSKYIGVGLPVRSEDTLNDCFKTMFIQLKTELNRYNELVALDLKTMDFDEMVDNH